MNVRCRTVWNTHRRFVLDRVLSRAAVEVAHPAGGTVGPVHERSRVGHRVTGVCGPFNIHRLKRGNRDMGIGKTGEYVGSRNMHQTLLIIGEESRTLHARRRLSLEAMDAHQTQDEYIVAPTRAVLEATNSASE